MLSLAHRARQRRRERASINAEGSINLVPLVDILTSIVFFSLLTYRGELLAELTAYDVGAPPVAVRAPARAAAADADGPVTVRVRAAGLAVEHPTLGAAPRAIAGVRGAALDTLGALAAAVRRAAPAAARATVIPDDDVAYDDVVHVLERLRLAGLTEIALGASDAGR